MKKLFLVVAIFSGFTTQAMEFEGSVFDAERCMFCPAGMCSCAAASKFAMPVHPLGLSESDFEADFLVTSIPVAVVPAVLARPVSGRKRTADVAGLPVAKKAKPNSIARVLGEKIKPGRFVAIPAPSAAPKPATRSATITPALTAAASAAPVEKPALTAEGKRAVYWCLCNESFADVATPRVIAHQAQCKLWKAKEVERRAIFKALTDRKSVV